MREFTRTEPVRHHPAVILGIVLALALAACSPGATASPPATSGPTGTATEAPSSPPEALSIAYLSFAVANSYDAPMLAAAQSVALENNATVTVFDAANNPETQFAQLQDAISSGRYDGILVQPIFGPSLVAEVERAIAEGIAVGVLDQILGDDPSTADAQVDGLAANVVFVQTEIGRKQGELVVQACTEANLDPCNVAYLASIKVSSLDTAIRSGFDAAIAGTPSIRIVAEGESFFSVGGGLSATQDILTRVADLSLLVGADQGIIGGAQAIEAAGRTGQIILIGYGASATGIGQVAAGNWYATVAQAPATEGRLAMSHLIQAIRTGTPVPGVDPVADLPAGGVVTKDNASQFVGEWPG
jgi:ribose transport system substrate-binding protein